MARITVVGGTGFTGTAIVKEAASRGHRVTAFSRSVPDEPVDGVEYVAGDASESPALVEGADVVVAALSPRGDLADKLRGIYAQLAEAAAANGARLVVIGGFSALRPAPGEPRIYTTADAPPPYDVEIRTMGQVLEDLESAPEGLDWVYISPAGRYGAHEQPPVEPRGTYRVGGEVALFDEDGESSLAPDDFALAIVDEIDRPAHRRTNIGIAY
ncbi:NAD(P)-dependent oxidoreductase [Nocardioides cheoyonin]|uniref:NAD(P)-dependent oxidoreductase n=1 Tax=Nocardioides cheoyonin TaxID=3156615 RepID=UPI0032B42483